MKNRHFYKTLLIKLRPLHNIPITFLILVRLKPDQNQSIEETRDYLMLLERISGDKYGESYKFLKLEQNLIFNANINKDNFWRFKKKCAGTFFGPWRTFFLMPNSGALFFKARVPKSQYN